jgi:hypothetical protein
MRGTNVTPEEEAEWRRLRNEEKLTYEEIGARFNRHGSTVRRRIHDGRKIGCKPGRKVADPDLLITCGGDMTEYRRLRRKQQKPDQSASRKWKENNKKKTKAYDEDRTWQERWRAAGSPPPSLGRTCTCEVPLLDSDSLCDWCGCFRSPPQTVLTSLTATQVHSEALPRPTGLRGVGERLQALDLETEVG